MISPLPILSQSEYDAEQTKFAIAILREISASISNPKNQRNQFDVVRDVASELPQNVHGLRKSGNKEGSSFSSPAVDEDSSGSSYTTAEEDLTHEDDEHHSCWHSEDDNNENTESSQTTKLIQSPTTNRKEMMVTMNGGTSTSSTKTILNNSFLEEDHLHCLVTRCNNNLKSSTTGSRTVRRLNSSSSNSNSGKSSSLNNPDTATTTTTTLRYDKSKREDNPPQEIYSPAFESQEAKLEGLLEYDEENNIKTISVVQLQRVFDALKVNDPSPSHCAALLALIESVQTRDDFQWALHQMGGFHAIIFLYARIVEICPNEAVQSKALSLALNQMKEEGKMTDSPAKTTRQYHLIRFVLNSERSIFGFETFLTLVNACLGGNGTSIRDYQLLNICLISSWKNLLRTRCTEEESPAGEKSLFEIFLAIILDLVVENNSLRDLNVGLLKLNKFSERILSICNGKIANFEVGLAKLRVEDALRIGSLVKSIFLELMAPPDAIVAVTLVTFGLIPLLPKELPPLPLKKEAFFVYQSQDSSETISSNSENFLESSNNNPTTTTIQQQQQQQNINNLNNENESKINNQDIVNRQDFANALQETLLEGIMSILLNAVSILPDVGFRAILNPHLSPQVLVAYCSHPNSTLKTLSLQLLAAYLSRVKNSEMTGFNRNRGFVLTSLYIQSCSQIASVALNTCRGFGPLSYSLIVGLIYSDDVVKGLVEWIKQDESLVTPALLSAGLLPSILNLHPSSQNLSRPLSQLLSLVTRYMVLHPKESPWKILFCPGIESASQTSSITARLIQDATEILRNYRGKELKKSDASERLLWLLERSSASRFGSYFDKWLLNTLALQVMEFEEGSGESETWRYFVKKHRKRLQYLMGVFLCKFLAPDRSELEFKQFAVRFLYMSCPNLAEWLPKVIRRDDQIERCFTAFLRMFFAEVDHKNSDVLESGLRSPASFQSLVSSNGNLILTLQAAAAVGFPQQPQGHNRKLSNASDYALTACPPDIHLSDTAIRSRFEELLVDAGVLSPSNNLGRSSTFSPDFKTFKILIEAPPISGVSYQELRQCLVIAEKLRATAISKSPSYTNMLKLQHNETTITFANSTEYFNTVFEAVNKYAEEVVDTLTRLRIRQEVEIAKFVCRREHDIIARQQWWGIRNQMTHPKAPWHFAELYPRFWALDQNEGPGRIRLRLRKQPLEIEQRFIKPSHRKSGSAPKPLEYLFHSDSIEFMGYPGIQSEIQFIRSCLRIVPGDEAPGEILISSKSLHFISEVCTQSCWNRVDVEKSRIRQVLRRRYTLEDRAIEIFVDSRSFLFVFSCTKDREAVVQYLSPRNGSFSTTQGLGGSTSNNLTNPTTTANMSPSLTTMTAQWVKGNLSNFDYLMYLNTAAGRTYCDLMQYPVFPFVLCKYDSPTLDLHAQSSYRNLMRPMAVQDPKKEDHFISTYNYLKREGDSTPFHYGSHYSNSGIVLHFLVRLPPYTKPFLKYQDGNFDIPDRSFHSVETMWRLASRESNTDYKEAIPEFYYLPEFLKNLQNFDMGIRQNGASVDDVKLPAWCRGDARLFTLINRQALESNLVRNYLSDWIDLIFGHKQTGPAAVQAVNVFHPSTYEGFEVNESGADEVVRRARKAMVATYGQTPKRLFPFPHPRPQCCPAEENSERNVLEEVTGVQLGNFVGSPVSSALDVVNTREFHEPVSLFETQGRIIFWPKQTLIMGDSIVGSWDASGVRIKSNIVYLCIGDEITICNGINDSLWIGHHSGRISVLKMNKELDKVIGTQELIGHYQPIKNIDLNEEFSTAISCSGQNYVILWDTNKQSFVNIIEESEAIDFVYSSRSTGDIVLLNHEKNQIKFKTINGFEIGMIEPEDQIESVCLSGLNPGTNVNLIAVGCDYGVIKFYSTWDLKFVKQIKISDLSTLAIQSIRYSRDGRRLYCMAQSEKTFISAAVQLSLENN